MDQDTSPAGASAANRPERLFTRHFIFATCINLVITIGFFALVTGMAVYAAEEFAAGETAAGFAASAFMIGAVFSRIFAGKWVNTLGRKPILVLCMLLYTLAGIAYLWTDSYELLIGLRLVHGVLMGFAQTALTAAVFDIIPKTRRGEGSGYYLMANALAPAVGPLVAIQISQRYGYDEMFITVAAISALGFLLALPLTVPEVKPAKATLAQRLRLSPRDIIEPRAVSIALVAMLISICFASVMAFLNGFAQSEGFVEAASIYFLVYAGVMLVTRMFMGRVQDRYGDNALVCPTLAVFFTSMALLAWAPDEWAIIVSGALAGFGFGAMMPAMQAIIASKLPTHRISIGLSTFFIMMDSGFGLAPLLLGQFVEVWGYQIMYAACAGVILLALCLYWLLHGKYSVKQGMARKRAHRWVNDATAAMPRVDPQQER